MENLSDIYFNWLYDSVKDEKLGTYYNLLHRLYQLPFFWKIRNDDSRVKDGLDLRYDFCDEKHLDYESIEELPAECSVLEMLIALAKRCETFVWDPDKGDRTKIWFWKFIDNLGLMDESDANFTDESCSKIDKYIDNFVNREYFRDGFGGLFPLRNPKKDQRKVEIWYQLQDWLKENYRF